MHPLCAGDEVISINDQPTEGWTGDMAAKLLRGKGGTEVRLHGSLCIVFLCGCCAVH